MLLGCASFFNHAFGGFIFLRTLALHMWKSPTVPDLVPRSADVGRDARDPRQGLELGPSYFVSLLLARQRRGEALFGKVGAARRPELAERSRQFVLVKEAASLCQVESARSQASG